jgi:hypothetical protein
MMMTLDDETHPQWMMVGLFYVKFNNYVMAIVLLLFS